MTKNLDLVQKTYYLHKDLDKDLIDFISNCRNTSELIRNALFREIRIQNGEIELIDIKNRKFLDSKIHTEQSSISEEFRGKANLKIRNHVFDSEDTKRTEVEEYITIGEYFESVKKTMKDDKVAYYITTKIEYDGMANFIFFYKFGRFYLHHTTDRDDFLLHDIKDLPISYIRHKIMKPEEFFLDWDMNYKEINKFIYLTFEELQIILNFIEDTSDTIRYESKILSALYDVLIKKYYECEEIHIQSNSVGLNIQFNLDNQQYISLYLYLKSIIQQLLSYRKGRGHWDNIRIVENLKGINAKIENVVGRKTLVEYNMWTIKD